jgi:hypothetical protein
MVNSRRNFIKNTTIAAAGVMVAPSNLFASEKAKNLIGDISKMKGLHKPITSFEEAIKLMLE